LKENISERAVTVLNPDRQIADETACEFLRLILPGRGYYVAMIVESEKRKYNEFAATIEDL